MKKIKILASSLILTSSFALSSSLISCGHKSSTTNDWGAFLKAAQAANGRDIITATQPTGWSDPANTEIKITNFNPNKDTKKITLDITRTKDNAPTTMASFIIQYVDNTEYDVSDWKCSTQPKIIDNNGWTDFKTAAKGATAIAIVGVTKPDSWSDAIAGELNIDNVKTDDIGGLVSLDITRSKNDGNATKASFAIQYIDNAKYRLSDWKCTAAPHSISETTWADFKKFGANVQAQALLVQAKPWDNKDDFTWTYGTLTERRWQANNSAVFDTFGSAKATDSFKGMKGKPIVDDINHKITAIFCKAKPNGNEVTDGLGPGWYNSDPIIATAQYVNGKSYSMASWTFAKTEQLQSFEMFSGKGGENGHTYEHLESLIKNEGWNGFIRNGDIQFGYWVNTYNNNNGGSYRSLSIMDSIKKEGFEGSIFGKGPDFGPTIDMANLQEEGKVGKQIKIMFPLTHQNKKWDFNLTMDYIYANGKDDTGGGSAFNFTFQGKFVAV